LRPPRAATYGSEMDIQELLSKVTDNLTVGRVFGEPVQHGDILVVPVARIRGGAGGGNGTGATEDLSNSGGGGGFEATPVGVFVLKNGSAEWHPALDVTRIAIGGQVVAVVLALVLRSILRRR
jgi:uncharacterized spore protein YtfJ